MLIGNHASPKQGAHNGPSSKELLQRLFLGMQFFSRKTSSRPRLYFRRRSVGDVVGEPEDDPPTVWIFCHRHKHSCLKDSFIEEGGFRASQVGGFVDGGGSQGTVGGKVLEEMNRS